MEKKQILEILKNIKKDFAIDKFVLFGSYAKGTNTNTSDIDIAYILDKNNKLSFDRYLLLEDRLKKQLKTKIDLMNFNKMNPLIKLDAKKDFIYV